MQARIAPVALLVAALLGCSSGAAITVTNNCPTTVRDIVLSGSGFSESVPSLAPGESSTLQVQPKGESGVAISFTAYSRKVVLQQQGYFEGGGAYRVSVSINPNLSATVRSRLWPQ